VLHERLPTSTTRLRQSPTPIPIRVGCRENLPTSTARLRPGCREQYAQAAGSGSPLTWEHMAGLQRLSHDLLFQKSKSPYLFHLSELTESLGANASVDPVLRSRFVNRIDPIYDEYTFLHATFQEYFAAIYASRLAEPEFEPLVDRAFYSASRLIVLEFVAGFPGPSARRLQEKAADWLEHPDRFQQVLLRVSRLAAPARWSLDGDGSVGKRVRDELWREIILRHRDNDLSAMIAFIEAFAALDPVDLCRRAKGTGELGGDERYIVSSVPARVAREVGLVKVLGDRWPYTGSQLGGGIINAELKSMRDAVTDQTRSDEDRCEAFTFLRSIQDAESVPALVSLLTNESMPREIQRETLWSLAAIGGQMAVDALVDVVTGKIAVSEGAKRSASITLRNTTDAMAALDPVGRDRLLRRLVLMRRDDPHVKFVLAALEGHPIRDGAELIGEIAQCRELTDEVRTQAVRAMATVADKAVAVRLVAMLETEPCRDVSNALLDMAVQKRLAVPVKYLRKRIGRCRSSNELLYLLKAFVQVMPHGPISERETAAGFLHSLIRKALRTDGANDASKSLAYALTRALPCAGSLDLRCIREDTFNLARNCLAQFVRAPERVPTTCILLSVAVVEHFHDADARIDLRRALDTALSPTGNRGFGDDIVSSSIARCLLMISPGELLDYPFNCRPCNRRCG